MNDPKHEDPDNEEPQDSFEKLAEALTYWLNHLGQVDSIKTGSEGRTPEEFQHILETFTKKTMPEFFAKTFPLIRGGVMTFLLDENVNMEVQFLSGSTEALGKIGYRLPEVVDMPKSATLIQARLVGEAGNIPLDLSEMPDSSDAEDILRSEGIQPNIYTKGKYLH